MRIYDKLDCFLTNTLIQFLLKCIHILKNYNRKKQRSPDFWKMVYVVTHYFLH